MDFRELERRLMSLIDAGQFDIAEAELHQARLQASEQTDRHILENVLSSLVTLFRAMEPPDFTKAESYCLELERVSGTGYAKLQTAMMLYWSMDNPGRTVTKAREAITAASQERDDGTLYQSFGLLGLALLDLHQGEEAVRVLGEIEKMVAARLRIVVGDETLFLERLFAKTKEANTRKTIQGIAKVLWPVCRDSEFTTRLKALADA
jgi:hypothetical protein